MASNVRDRNGDSVPAIHFCHQRSTRVALARVFAASVVAGADHLVVDDHVDALVSVPVFTLSVVNQRHVHGLKWNKWVYY